MKTNIYYAVSPEQLKDFEISHNWDVIRDLKDRIDTFLLSNPELELDRLEHGYNGDDFIRNVITIIPVFRRKKNDMS